MPEGRRSRPGRAEARALEDRARLRAPLRSEPTARHRAGTKRRAASCLSAGSPWRAEGLSDAATTTPRGRSRSAGRRRLATARRATIRDLRPRLGPRGGAMPAPAPRARANRACPAEARRRWPCRAARRPCRGALPVWGSSSKRKRPYVTAGSRGSSTCCGPIAPACEWPFRIADRAHPRGRTRQARSGTRLRHRRHRRNR